MASSICSTGLLVAAQVLLRMDHDSQRIEGDRQLHVLDAGFLAGFHFLFHDRTRSILDIGFAAAEFLEAAAGAGNADRDINGTSSWLSGILPPRLR
jgi:hypothetical protein